MHAPRGAAAFQCKHCDAAEVGAQGWQFADDRLEEVEVDSFKRGLGKGPLLSPAVHQVDGELSTDLLLCSELLGSDPDLCVWNKQRNFVAPGRKRFLELRVLNHKPIQFCPRSVWVLLQAFDEGVELFGG
ncbi:hypothetical protein D3C86_1393710 [compost metagenome]